MRTASEMAAFRHSLATRHYAWHMGLWAVGYTTSRGNAIIVQRFDRESDARQAASALKVPE